MDSDHARPSEEQLEAYFEAYLALQSKYNRVMYSLFIAFFGQGVLYSSFIEAHFGRRLGLLGMLLAGMPWLVYFSITFIRVPPPIMPRGFRRVLLFIICWYATSTVVLVVISIAKLNPTTLQGSTLAWICALAGWFGIPTLIHSHNVLHRNEVQFEPGGTGN